MTRRKKHNKKRIIFLLKLLSFIIVLCTAVYLVDSFIRSPIKAAAEFSSKQIVAEIINNAVADAIDECGYTYTDLTNIERNSSNNIVSIEANTINITRLQSAVTKNVINDLKPIDHTTSKIPVGSLFGSELLSGIGPDLKIKFTVGNYVKSKTISKFTSSGINQTNHTIIISTEIDIISIIAGREFKTTVPNEFIAAQTIVVGDIPEYFTKIVTQDKELVNALDAYDTKPR